MKSKSPSAKQQAIFQQARELHHSGRLAEAWVLFQSLLKHFPKHPLILGELGTIAIAQANFEQGAYLLGKSLQANPNDADVCFNRGLALARMNQADAALKCFAQAINLRSGFAEAHYNRADIFKNLNKPDEAITEYQRALLLTPDYVEAHNDLGLLHQACQQYTQAIVCYRQAISLRPNYVNAYYNCGSALQYLGHFSEALTCYDSLIALQPGDPKAYFNRGQVLAELKRYEQALASYDQALALNPDYPYLFGQRLFTQMQICAWGDIQRRIDELEDKIEAGEGVVTPFTVLACSSSLLLQKQAAERWIADKFPVNNALPKSFKYVGHDKIRIGYFSADFRHHAVAFLTAELYEKHDRDKFEVIGFSFGSDSNDPIRQRLKVGFDRFLEVQDLTDFEIAQLARDLEVDIAIDLGGHTGDGRPGIFALRAAPVQVSYLGYLGTMGANYIDYLLADAVLIPESAKSFYTEKIVYLPGYQVNDGQRQIADSLFTREQLGLPETGFVFCCFNNSYKITNTTFAVWMRILQIVEGSVLFLHADDEIVVRNLKNAATLAGVDANRLVFGQTLPLPEYMARYRLVDLFLDTLPYNAGTTASDALWAGVPVLTCIGATFAGRVAASLLTAIGLLELIATSYDQYIALAIKLATEPDSFAAIKSRLAENRLTTPLFNCQQFTFYLEEAYAVMYRRRQNELLPDDIYIGLDGMPIVINTKG